MGPVLEGSPREDREESSGGRSAGSFSRTAAGNGTWICLPVVYTNEISDELPSLGQVRPRRMIRYGKLRILNAVLFVVFSKLIQDFEVTPNRLK